MKKNSILSQFIILIFSFLVVFMSLHYMKFEEKVNTELQYVDFYLEKDTYYVAKDTQINLEIHNPQNLEYTIKFEEEGIANVEEQIVYAKQYGKTEFEIYIGTAKVNEGVLYVVKGIEKIPSKFNTKKEKITCNEFTKEENDILDLTLNDRIESAGYQTRAGSSQISNFRI